MAEGQDADRGELLGRVASGFVECFDRSGAGQGVAAVIVRRYLGFPAAVGAGVPVALVDG